MAIIVASRRYSLLERVNLDETRLIDTSRQPGDSGSFASAGGRVWGRKNPTTNLDVLRREVRSRARSFRPCLDARFVGERSRPGRDETSWEGIPGPMRAVTWELRKRETKNALHVVDLPRFLSHRANSEGGQCGLVGGNGTTRCSQVWGSSLTCRRGEDREHARWKAGGA